MKDTKEIMVTESTAEITGELEFQLVGDAEDFETGQAKRVVMDGVAISVWRLEDGFYAIDDTCPHAGASLTHGFHERGIIACPRHGAQSAPHMRLDMKAVGCDFYAISGHKMCGPSGSGALWGKAELLEKFEPVYGGGEMISHVTLDDAEWNEIPFKFEAGTPNIEGAVGLGAAVTYLESIGMENIERYVCELAEFAHERLSDIPGVRVFGPARDRTGAVSFWLDDVHPHDLASILDCNGIAVRAGHHCAAPLTEWLGLPATVRASFYIYNTVEEVNLLAASVSQARMVMGHVA